MKVFLVDLMFKLFHRSKQSSLRSLATIKNSCSVCKISYSISSFAHTAVCAKDDIEYEILQTEQEFLIVAKDLKEDCLERWKSLNIKSTKKTFMGALLENLVLKHPLYERLSPLFLADHVTTETGTGFVHTAPAHGVDDFNVCNKEGIEINNPISTNGCYKENVGLFSGQHVITCCPENKPTFSL